MGTAGYTQKARYYLEMLCSIPSGRSAGSPGNRAATDFFMKEMEQWGYTVDATPFKCLDFRSGGAALSCGGKEFQVHANPYSTGCDVTAGLVAVSTVEELKKCTCNEKILLMRGEICAEHLMPRNYPFYCPDSHKDIYALLDQKQPAAIIAATARNPALMGALYPYPLIEDGDLDIPGVYCTGATGKKIEALKSDEWRLTIDAGRIPSTARNVIATAGPEGSKKVVVCAHIDARPGMPGALDNASGAAVLLLVAEMLKPSNVRTGIELVAISGEEHYAACGEVDYLRRYGKELGQVQLAVNIDGIGYVNGKTAYSFYGCPAALSRKVRGVFKASPGLAEGEPWYAGDHMVFAQAGRPALALTSENALELSKKIIHTPKDTPDLVKPEKLVEAAEALTKLLITLDARP